MQPRIFLSEPIGRHTVAIAFLLTFQGNQLLHGQNAPLAYTSPAWVNSLTNIHLNGFVLPNGLDTSAWFEWGTNGDFYATSPAILVPSNGALTRVTMAVDAPVPGRAYDVRIVASNATAVARGAVTRFTPQSELRLAWGSAFDRRLTYAIHQPVGSAVCASGQTLAVKLDGGVAAWGGSSTLTNVPTAATNVVSVAAGINNNAVLRADGSVLVWGDNASGQTNVPVDLTNAVAISFGVDHCLALRSDGTVVAWGGTNFNESVVPSGLSNVVAVAAGKMHSAALDIHGKVRAWGAWTYTNVPNDWTNIVSIACDPSATFALRNDGTVAAFPGGALGGGFTNLVQIAANASGGGIAGVRQDQTLAYSGALPPFSQTNGVVSVAVGSGAVFGLALVPARLGKPGTLSPMQVRPNSAVLVGMVSPNQLPTSAWFEWGTNAQLGQVTPHVDLNTTDGVAWFTNEITGLEDGGTYLYRLASSNQLGLQFGSLQRFTTGGKLSAWGLSSALAKTPTGLDHVVSADSGRDHTIALLNDGTVRCWGANFSGQTNVPVNLTNVVAVSAGWQHCLALKADGTVTAWGWNGGGQTNVPVGLSNVAAIAAGGWHSAALTRSGDVVVWGGNAGYGGSALRSPPADAYNLVGIATSGDHMVALRNSGEVFAWGANLHGELNIPAAVSNSFGIAAPVWDCVALDSQGSPNIWGWNIAGQTNPPAGLSNLVSVVGGWFHLLALTADGQIVAWGTNCATASERATSLGTTYTNGPVTLPSGLTNVAAIGAGDWSSLAIGPNLPPMAGDLVVTGFVNSDLIITLPSPADYNGDSFTFRCESLPEGGSLYQFNNGSPGALLNLNDAISDPDGRFVFRPASQQLGMPLTSFTYVANDGTDDSLPAHVTVHIVLPAAPVIDASSAHFVSASPDTGFAFRFAGSSNASYSVWSSTNLMDWEFLGSGVTTSNQFYEFLDSQAKTLPRRFYQIRSP